MQQGNTEMRQKKKATNLTIRADLLDIAREDGLNLSSMLESTLIEYCRQKREKLWLEENRAGIDAFNERIDRCGIFGAKHRRF